MLYRQARGEQPFAGELAGMRSRIIEVVAGLLESACAAAPVRARPGDFMPMAYAWVGAAESLADWLADDEEEDPEDTATRMMNFVWVGADSLLRGRIWRAPGHGSQGDGWQGERPADGDGQQ